MQMDRKIAVLIDADNVSSKYVRYILDEISNHGIPTYKRIYGDWTTPQLAPWKNLLLKYSITPIQQYSYTTGKNSTDSALIIDAMDILYSKNVDGFCIVSSDSDFTRLAARLREAGVYVIGMGETKTPMPFIAACEKFKYLEVLAKADATETAPAPDMADVADNTAAEPARDGMTSLRDIIETIKNIIDEKADPDSWVSLAEVGDILNKRYPDFDSRNYGYAKLKPFVSSISQFEVMSQSSSKPHINHIFIRNKVR